VDGNGGGRGRPLAEEASEVDGDIHVAAAELEVAETGLKEGWSGPSVWRRLVVDGEPAMGGPRQVGVGVTSRVQAIGEGVLGGAMLQVGSRCSTVVCSLYSRQRRWNESGAAARLWAANNGSEAVGVGKVVAAAVRRRSARPGHLCSDRENDGWAPCGFDFFQFIQNWLNFKNSKGVHYIAPKIPNFCMRLARDIINNFLHFVDIQFNT
jgi:hypothetical protein